MFEEKKAIEKVLTALSEQLEVEGVKHLEIVVCGGVALNITGYVHRTTLDIDVLAIIDYSMDAIVYVAKDKSEAVSWRRRIR